MLESLVGLLGGLLGLAFSIVSLAGVVFGIWMLIDCIKNEPSGGNKIIWIVVIVLTCWLGGLIYFFVQRPKRLA